MKITVLAVFAALSSTLASSVALAVSPPMPGATSGGGANGMKHAMVGLVGETLSAFYVASPPPTPVVMLSGHGVDYTPAKFDVLENKFFNAQHGWLPDGFISLSADRSLWIERTGATQPAGASFHVYEAGMGMEMASWTMNEIYATDGAKWQWDGAMQHDFYVSDKPGSYSMSFRVFVGDANGTMDLTYTPATTTFSFVAVPEPATAVLAGFGAIAVALWRKR